MNFPVKPGYKIVKGGELQEGDLLWNYMEDRWVVPNNKNSEKYGNAVNVFGCVIRPIFSGLTWEYIKANPGTYKLINHCAGTKFVSNYKGEVFFITCCDEIEIAVESVWNLYKFEKV